MIFVYRIHATVIFFCVNRRSTYQLIILYDLFAAYDVFAIKGTVERAWQNKWRSALSRLLETQGRHGIIRIW